MEKLDSSYIHIVYGSPEWERMRTVLLDRIGKLRETSELHRKLVEASWKVQCLIDPFFRAEYGAYHWLDKIKKKGVKLTPYMLKNFDGKTHFRIDEYEEYTDFRPFKHGHYHEFRCNICDRFDIDNANIKLLDVETDLYLTVDHRNDILNSGLGVLHNDDDLKKMLRNYESWIPRKVI